MSIETADRVQVSGPGPAALFWAFLEVAVHSFGGAAAWSRIVLVQRRSWLSEAEFTELLGLGQVLPGPNVVNVAAIVGDRACGPIGSVAALAGLLWIPTAGAVLLDVLLMHAAHMPGVAGAVRGLGAGAAGLVWAMGLQLGKQLGKTRWALGIAAVAFLATALLGVSLLWVVFILGPLGVLAAWRERR